MDEDVFLEAEELDLVDVRLNPDADAPDIPEVAFHLADVGDMKMVGVNQRIPAGWRVCGDTEHPSEAFPTFVRMLGIAEPSFTVPSPPARPGFHWVVKLKGLRG